MMWLVCFLLVSTGVSNDIVSGQGSWKYRYEPDLLKIPTGATEMLNGHGLAVWDESIYFTYQPASVENGTQALVSFSLDGKNSKMLGIKGPTGISSGVPHGLRKEYDPTTNEMYLYHANNQQMIFKTKTDGSIIWATNLTNWQTDHPEYWPILPNR
eukprot:UN05202